MIHTFILMTMTIAIHLRHQFEGEGTEDDQEYNLRICTWGEIASKIIWVIMIIDWRN